MPKVRVRFFSGILFGFFLLSLCAIVVIYQLIEANKLSTFTIETSKIPILKPHPHVPWLDSIRDEGHHVFARSNTSVLPYDAWIKGFNAKVINAESHVIHHLFLGRTDKKDELCPNYPWQGIFVTSEVNTYPQIFPGDYAMFLPQGTPLRIFTMLHNTTPPLGPGKRYKDVTLQVEMYVQKDSIFTKHQPIEYHRLHLSDKPCSNAERAEIFEVPPYSKDFIKKNSVSNIGRPTSSYTFSAPGTIIGMGGHFHPFEGGENVEVDLNDQPVATFTANEIDYGTWKTWNIPVLPYTTIVKKGDKISISSKYSNPNSYPVRGAMGMAVVYFAKD